MDDIARGLDAHRRGVLATAPRKYSAVLHPDPPNFDVSHLLGAVATQRGEPRLTLQLLVFASEVRPRAAEPYDHFALTLDALGQRRDAGEVLREALSTQLGDIDALRNLARVLAISPAILWPTMRGNLTLMQPARA